MTLFLAVTACYCSFGQSGKPARVEPPGKTHPLDWADSLAMIDAGVLIPKVAPFPEVIQTVLTDFPFNLRHITGELVLAQGEFENYASIVQLQEAQHCTITRYHSVDDTTVSWQAKMNRYDEFAAASHQYQELYKKLEHCYLRLVDGSIVYLQGVWEPAKEEAAFTTSTLRLTTGDWRYKEVKVELELVFLLTEWEVNINILTKKRDDEVGGGSVGDQMK